MSTCHWFEFKHSQQAGPSQLMKERIRGRHRATQSLAGPHEVNDAGALAPVVFSDDDGSQTCEIRKLKAKGRPSPPISTLLNSMVVSVLAESACTNRFEEDSLRNPKHGNLWFLRASCETIAQIGHIESHEHNKSIRINRNKQIIKMQNQESFEYVWMYMARFRLLWSLAMMYTYSILPPEHNGMVLRAWKWLEIRIRNLTILEKFWQNKGCVWG